MVTPKNLRKIRVEVIKPCDACPKTRYEQLLLNFRKYYSYVLMPEETGLNTKCNLASMNLSFGSSIFEVSSIAPSLGEKNHEYPLEIGLKGSYQNRGGPNQLKLK